MQCMSVKLKQIVLKEIPHRRVQTLDDSKRFQNLLMDDGHKALLFNVTVSCLGRMD
jgi:hypothetical protein